jgi:hypothetical protein
MTVKNHKGNNFLLRGETNMTTRSKIICVLIVLIFAFTSLSAFAFVQVQTAAHSTYQLDTAYHSDGSFGGSAYSIAGHCDISPLCGSGGG